MAQLPPKSLLDGVEQAVCAELGIVSCRHRSALHSLAVSKNLNLPATIFRVISDNWHRSGASEQLQRSRQNWRWSLQTQIGSENRSPEVVVERAIAAACARTDRDDWANQIPVASGLVIGAADGRRAIDLVHRRSAGQFELIELKIGSDTPLYAAVEAIGYAALWLLTRAEPKAPATALLGANTLIVRVLAPAAYYRAFELSPLERSLDDGLKRIARDKAVRMDFRYDVLDDRILLGPALADAELLSLLDQRAPLHPTDSH